MNPLFKKIEPNRMFMRMGLFTAESEKPKVSVSVSVSGGSIIVEVDDPKWGKKNKGQITPFRYEITGKTMVSAAIDAYLEDIKNLKKK
jgi:hypothetical protein